MISASPTGRSMCQTTSGKSVEVLPSALDLVMTRAERSRGFGGLVRFVDGERKTDRERVDLSLDSVISGHERARSRRRR